MSLESFNMAYACAHGYLYALAILADNALSCDDSKEGLEYIRRAKRFGATFSAMTPSEKEAWYEAGHPTDIGEPQVQGTPLPGLITGEEIQACLRRTG